MATAAIQLYPGETASPRDIMSLADEYHKAAIELRGLGRKGHPISWSPFRLCAIHSVELYLNACLLQVGHPAAMVRGMQHDLNPRAELATSAGLVLRMRTVDHLRVLAGSREYLFTRYGPEAAASMSEITCLIATLGDVSRKVTGFLARPAQLAAARK